VKYAFEDPSLATHNLPRKRDYGTTSSGNSDVVGLRQHPSEGLEAKTYIPPSQKDEQPSLFCSCIPKEQLSLRDATLCMAATL
jgi:hypothetical protein